MAKRNKHHLPLSSPAALISNKRRRITPADDSLSSSAPATPSMAAPEPSIPPAAAAAAAAAAAITSTSPSAPTVHIVAGSKIQTKVRAALSTLSIDSDGQTSTGSAAKDGAVGGSVGRIGTHGSDNHVVLLQGRASAASKLITIAEVVKRTLDRQGRPWWAYAGVRGVLEPFEAPRRISLSKKKLEKQSDGQVAEQSDGSTEEDQKEEAFEPLSRDRINAASKVRNVAVMTIYLATKPIPALKTLYGEQSSGSLS